jgi:hypothetical protein
MSTIRLTTAVVGAFLVLFSTAHRAVAQLEGRAITIIPPRFELFANPGEQISEIIRVRNDSEAPAAYTILVEDFTSAGEEGQVVLEEGESDVLFSLAKWIQPEATDIILQPGEERAFNFLINVPKNAEPGGHYASILFQGGGGDVQGGASVVQRIGSLILLRVSGNVTENAAIETFAAPSYSQETPLNFTLRLKNNGNTHVRPKGTIIITDIFGKKVDELPLNGQNVLPAVVRKMDTEWTKPNALGYYTATLVATYGQQNLPLTAAAKFIVISTPAAILIGVGLIAGLLFILSILSGKSRLLRALQVIISGK